MPLLLPQLLLLLLVMRRAGCGVAVMGVVVNMRWACAVGAACDPRCAGFAPRPLGKGGAGWGWHDRRAGLIAGGASRGAQACKHSADRARSSARAAVRGCIDLSPDVVAACYAGGCLRLQAFQRADLG